MAKKKRKNNKKRSNKEDIRTKRIALILFFIALIGITSFLLYRKYYTEPNKFESDKYYIRGIDVSHHNPILDWNNVEAQNISFAYIKATEGNTHKDRNYLYNYDLAKNTKVKIGSYHFYIFGLSGKEQASHFLNTAKFNSGDLIPAIDIEHSKANPHSTDSTFLSSVKKELQVLENTLYEHFGVHPIIYTNKECYRLYVKNLLPENTIWICDLHKEPSDDISNWKIWQFSHEGKIKGIPENIDLNYYRYSFEQFCELLLP